MIERLDRYLQLRIAGYCDPMSLCCLSRTDREWSALPTSALCLPRALLNMLEIRECDLREDMSLVRSLLRSDPKWVTELWAVLSDSLCQEKISRCRRGFCRPPSGQAPTRISLQDARSLHTWEGPYRRPVQRHPSAPHLMLHHEVYRMDRLRMRLWKQLAPTAIALIY